MCIKHSGGSVLHCSFRFLISFGHVGQNAAGLKPRYVLYTDVASNAVGHEK